MSTWVDLGIPALIAALGYVGKLVVEARGERQRWRRQRLSDQLQHFCYPVLTRLRENGPIYTLIAAGQDGELPRGAEVATCVQEQVLRNHEAVLEVIAQHRHLLPFDAELDAQLQLYIRHVVFYRALIRAGVEAFPGQLGVPYPSDLDELLAERTRQLQEALDRTWG